MIIAIRLQSAETATAVVFAPTSGEMRLGGPLAIGATNASIVPLVSPATRLVAADRKPTHDGSTSSAPSKDPSTEGANDGPSAGAPLSVRETSTFGPGTQSEPSLKKRPERSTAKTSRCPLVSFGTRSVASDSKAIARA